MVGTIPRRGCAVVLTVFVCALVGLAGAPPAVAATEMGDAVLYYTAGDNLARVGAFRTAAETFPVVGATSVALDDDGTVYVASGSSVREFKSDGSWSDSLISGVSSATDVAARGGKLVVADLAGAALRTAPDVSLVSDVHPTKVATTGAAVYFVDNDDQGVYRYANGDGITPVSADATTSLAVDADGMLYLGQATKIVKYDPVENQGTDLVTGLSGAPIDLAVSEGGDVYYASSDGEIVRVSGAGEAATSVATGVEGLTSIAVRTTPSAPAAIAAEGGDGKASVFWMPSATNGGASPVRYEVAAFTTDEEGKAVPVDVPVCATLETSCTFNNLENGTYYSFQVTAFNTAEGNGTGSSLPTSAEGVYAHVGPEAPILDTPVAGNGAASVTFAPGNDNGVSTTEWLMSTDRLKWDKAEVLPAADGRLETVFASLVNDQLTTLYLRAYEPETGVTGAVGSATVTPDGSVPEAPLLVDVQPGEESATLTFKPGSPGGSDITGYQASVDGGSWAEVEATSDVPGEPSDETSSPAEDSSTPPKDETSPAEDQSSPAEDQSSPAEEQSSPSEGESTPAEGESSPSEGESTPAEGESSPSEGESTPAEQESSPSEGESTPAEGESSPSEGESTPAEGESSPSEGESTPAEGESSPSEGESTPAEGQGMDEVPGPLLSVVLQDLTEAESVIRLRARNEQGTGVFAFTHVRPTTTTPPTTTPATTEPTTEPETTEPETTEPETTTPATTTPATTTPATTTPATTEPATTAPATTTPATTTPATTTPATTTPATTTPATTTPATTTPATTTPATTTPATTTPATTTPATTSATTTPATTTSATSAPTSSATPAPNVSTIPAPVVPLAPTGVSAAAGLASVTVSWNASADNGARITGYRATASPGGASCTTSGTSCVVGGDAGTSYTVSVVALSAVGTSPPSATSNPVTPIELTVPSSAPVTDLPLGTPDGPVTSAAPGGKLKMSGRGYAPFSVVTLAVYSEPTVLGTVTADANGAFETEIDVPDNLSLGKHSFVAAGVDKNGNFRALRLDLTVAETPAGDDGKKLPVTGSAVLWMIVAGFASVVTGTALRRLAN